jgi:diguanylate cyclase (GGDEF)-like protein
MIAPPLPDTEHRRLTQLQGYGILDTDYEQAYDDLLMIAAGICGTPMGSVSLIDSDRQWFKAQLGLPVAQTSRDVAFCAHAILQPEKVMVVPDALEDQRFHDNPLVTGEPNIRFYAGAPLVGSGGEAVGTLCVMDSAPRQLTATQVDAMARLSRQVVALLELRKAYQELARHLSEREWYERQLDQHQQALIQENAELTQQSRTDALTGLPNRRAFNAVMEQALADAIANSRALSLAIIDIDHFKSINDLHGHPVGDATLVAIAQALQAQAASVATVARFGGEEFAAVLPGMDLLAAERHCQFMREAVANLSQGLPATVSIGVTEFAHGDSISQLYTRADEALYAAKRAGRDCVRMNPADR